jgi:hypothetical protein
LFIRTPSGLLADINKTEGVNMQDYSKLYPSRFRSKAKCSKLAKVRRLLLSGLPAEIILLLIAAVVLPGGALAAIRR